jgi:hypothetical protein
MYVYSFWGTSALGTLRAVQHSVYQQPLAHLSPQHNIASTHLALMIMYNVKSNAREHFSSYYKKNNQADAQAVDAQTTAAFLGVYVCCLLPSVPPLRRP